MRLALAAVIEKHSDEDRNTVRETQNFVDFIGHLAQIGVASRANKLIPGFGIFRQDKTVFALLSVPVFAPDARVHDIVSVFRAYLEAFEKVPDVAFKIVRKFGEVENLG